MTTSDQLKLQAKAVHEAAYATPQDTIDKLTKAVRNLKAYISEIDDAIAYCVRYKLEIESMTDAIEQYHDRENNSEWLDDQQADLADFANKSRKEDN